MRALVFDGERIGLREDYPTPSLRDGWAVVAVTMAGICRTDLEIVRGYTGFTGVLGHEMVGVVAECHDSSWIGKRVVGEINVTCGACDYCAIGLGRHCRDRRVLGIAGLDGCFAERCSLPIDNLRVVPEEIADDRAVFVEPLAAALEILDQVGVTERDRCVVLGDGKLGILCAWVLATVARDVTLVGHHQAKLEVARWHQVKTTADLAEVEPGADLVVEATGKSAGLDDAISRCRPRGTIILKSTVATPRPVDLSPVVVGEMTLLGSRCGLFFHALEGLERHQFPVERLIAARYPLGQGEAAFEHAARGDALKVLVEVE